MKIEDIIYETTRSIYSVEDKLRIATIFIFCYQLSAITFAELLYCKNHNKFIDKLNNEYSKFEVDFTIKLSDKNINDCFIKTLNKVKEKYDDNGYYKALFNKDTFALVIEEIVNFDFNAIKFKKLTKVIAKQLELNF